MRFTKQNNTKQQQNNTKQFQNNTKQSQNPQIFLQPDASRTVEDERAPNKLHRTFRSGPSRIRIVDVAGFHWFTVAEHWWARWNWADEVHGKKHDNITIRSEDSCWPYCLKFSYDSIFSYNKYTNMPKIKPIFQTQNNSQHFLPH
jgi:hypothetical protein